MRPPVPKPKLWSEQAGSEHRASARGKGGIRGGVERGLEEGQRPHNRPLSTARRAQGERSGKKGRKRKDAGCSRKEQGSGESPTPVEVGGNVWAFPLYSSPSVAIPCALRAGQARGLLWETCGFPPEAPPCNLPRNPPSLSESNVSPSARRPRVPTKASLSEHSDLSARDRMEGHAQAPRHADTLPAVRPGRERDFSQVVPALRQSLRRRAGVRTKGNTLVLTSCRPPCGDGCVRPPVPKAKLWLEQAGSEHRASARGKGGDSGVWKGASKGGNAPITGPFPLPGGHKGRVMERRGENGKMPVVPATASARHVPRPPAIPPTAGRGTHEGGYPCRNFMPPPIRGWMCAPACSESEALVGTGGQRTQSLSAR